jgi:plasmid stability protein
VSTLTIRDLDDGVKARLRVRAAEHGRSMEAEARAILGDALAPPGSQAPDLAGRLRSLVATHGGYDLALPERSDQPREVDLSDLLP